MSKKSFQTQPPTFLLCAQKTARGLALLVCCLMCMFLMHFFVVVGGKSDQDFPSKPHPPAFLFFPKLLGRINAKNVKTYEKS